jgi:hypothetical protein
VDDELGLVALGCGAARVDGLVLGRVDAADAVVAFTANRPAFTFCCLRASTNLKKHARAASNSRRFKAASASALKNGISPDLSGNISYSCA